MESMEILEKSEPSGLRKSRVVEYSNNSLEAVRVQEHTEQRFELFRTSNNGHWRTNEDSLFTISDKKVYSKKKAIYFLESWING
jgi:hypothetical protein